MNIVPRFLLSISLIAFFPQILLGKFLSYEEAKVHLESLKKSEKDKYFFGLALFDEFPVKNDISKPWYKFLVLNQEFLDAYNRTDYEFERYNAINEANPQKNAPWMNEDIQKGMFAEIQRIHDEFKNFVNQLSKEK